MKVTDVPWQIEFELAEIVIEGFRDAFTFMTIEFEVTGVGPAHTSLLFIWQVTISLFESEFVVNAELLVPTLMPLTFH